MHARRRSSACPIARTLGNCLSAANYARLVDLIGPARTKDLLFTGRLIDATEAAALGLVTRMADADAIDDAVRELAATIAANAPLTIRATKEAVRRIAPVADSTPASTDDLIAPCYASDDFQRRASPRFSRSGRRRFTGRLISIQALSVSGRRAPVLSAVLDPGADSRRSAASTPPALERHAGEREPHLDAAQRAHQHQLVEVAEVTDAERASLQPAEAGAERQVEALEDDRPERVGVVRRPASSPS